MQSSTIPVAPGTSTSSVYYPPAETEEHDFITEQKATTSSARIFCLNIVQNFTQFCLGGIIICAMLIPVHSEANARPLTQHIVLCSVGYFLLLGQAILSFSPVGWARNVKSDNQRVLYSILQILGSILAIAGCCMTVLFYNDLPLFFSYHGKCGFVAMLLTILNLIAGVFSLIFHQRMKSPWKIVYMSLGSVTIIVAFIAVILAFNLYYRFDSVNGLANLSIIITVLALIGVIVLSGVKIMKHISENL